MIIIGDVLITQSCCVSHKSEELLKDIVHILHVYNYGIFLTRSDTQISCLSKHVPVPAPNHTRRVKSKTFTSTIC